MEQGPGRKDDDLHSITYEESVYSGSSNMSLPAAVAQCWPKDYPTPSSAKRGIRKGLFSVNGAKRKAKCGVHVNQGDTIKRKIPRGDNYKKHAPPQFITQSELQVAWLDPMLAVVVKPQGMSVGNHRDTTSEGSMHQLLLFSLPPTTGTLPLRRPSAVHRIDKATYGLLIIARTQPAARALSTAFESRCLQKRYRAVVVGFLQGETGFVKSPLSGKECESEWRVVKRFSIPTAEEAAKGMHAMTLVDLFPHTGRTHQLRRHMLSLGHPIVGDAEYGQEATNEAITAAVVAPLPTPVPVMGDGSPALPLMLAAVELVFPHPSFSEAATAKDATTNPNGNETASTRKNHSEENHQNQAALDVDNATCKTNFVQAMCESSLDEAKGTLRVQINMPMAMRMLVDRLPASI